MKSDFKVVKALSDDFTKDLHAFVNKWVSNLDMLDMMPLTPVILPITLALEAVRMITPLKCMDKEDAAFEELIEAMRKAHVAYVERAIANPKVVDLVTKIKQGMTDDQTTSH